MCREKSVLLFLYHNFMKTKCFLKKMDPCIYSRSSKDLKNTLTFENRKFSQKRNFCILLSERVALSDLSLRYRVSMWNGAQDYNLTSVVPPHLTTV